MKKILSLVLIFTLVLALAACGATATLPTDEDNIQQIPNPWLNVVSMDEAEAFLGYGMTAPETVAGLSQSAIRVLNDTDMILEIQYGRDDSRASLRKGTGPEDISGDYNTYESTEKVTVGGIEVTLKGKAGYTLAIWSSEGYSYSLSLSSPLDMSGWQAVIESII